MSLRGSSGFLSESCVALTIAGLRLTDGGLLFLSALVPNQVFYRTRLCIALINWTPLLRLGFNVTKLALIR